ncbi:hypothetical protein pipiens_017799 [Culex pipiens pipiens]|uniref:Uncharacterized protein n=1 Tax=Culex pipiens pipiens TaxID=38569 RepID=A0ABD1CF31_CULPP
MTLAAVEASPVGWPAVHDPDTSADVNRVDRATKGAVRVPDNAAHYQSAVPTLNDGSVRDPNYEPTLDKQDKQVENEEHDEGDPSLLGDLSIYEYYESFKATCDESPAKLNKTAFSDVDELCMDELAKETLEHTTRKISLRKTNRIAKEKGLQYVRKNGTIVQARRVRAPCKCKKKCYDKYTLSVRRQLLSNFLRLKSSGQNQFLANHMVVKLTTRVRVVNSRRTYTRIYKMPAVNGTTIVCKQMFMRTFDVNDRKLRVLAAKIVKGNGVAEDDGRLNNTSPRTISEDAIKFIKSHIKSFPAYTSHYAREESLRLYLSSDLNVKRMHELYQAKCYEDGVQPVHYTTYRIIFKSFNMSFRKRKVDTCNRCDELRVRLKITSDADERSKIETERDNHHDAAKRVYAEKKRDMEKARTDSTVRTTSFDLQKQLATPFLTCGSSYYARQLYTYNLTLFTATTKKNIATCNMWDETKARRGSQEIGSCIMKDVNSLPPTVNCVNYYSDRVAEQQRTSAEDLPQTDAVWAQSHGSGQCPWCNRADEKALHCGHRDSSSVGRINLNDKKISAICGERT